MLTPVGTFFVTYWKSIGTFFAGWYGRGMIEENKSLKKTVEGLENDKKQIARYNEIKDETSRLTDAELRERMRNLH